MLVRLKACVVAVRPSRAVTCKGRVQGSRVQGSKVELIYSVKYTESVIMLFLSRRGNDVYSLVFGCYSNTLRMISI